MSFVRYLKEKLLLDSTRYIYDFYDKERDTLYNISKITEDYAIIEVIKEDEVDDHTLEIEYEINHIKGEEGVREDYEFIYKENKDIEELPDTWDWDKFEEVILSEVKDFDRY
ncbi:MAG: hypothetical protein ACOC33_02200 [bacterium]